eukprot:jgi/Psemu1/42458/gm1.42458_g
MMACSTRRKPVAGALFAMGLILATNGLPFYERFVSRGRCRHHDPLLSQMRYGTVSSAVLTRTRKHRSIGRRARSTTFFLLSTGNENNDAKNIAKGFPFVFGFLTRKNFLLASTLLLIPPILLELYSRFGTFSIPNRGMNESDDISFLPTPKTTDWRDVEHATIVFHGAGGEDEYTNELMNRLDSVTELKYKSESSQKCNYYNHIVDWSKYSTNILQASYNGQRIGQMTAEELLEQTANTTNNLKTVHIIGISVGAFSADAAADEVKKHFQNNKSKNAPFVQLTLLDPFQQRGIFGVGYGNKMFGKSADYAQQFLNTDDPVPSTNKPLENTVCYDVTNLRPETIFGHDWPLVYYARSDRCGELAVEIDGKNSNKSIKMGAVVVL